MIDQVLIAEDHDSANLSLQKTLEDLQIKRVDHVFYCDDALLKIQNNAAKNPYDLLITDLSFEEDATNQKITSGIKLIEAARAAQPGLKVLVFSAENRATVIDNLFKQQAIDGFVRKARNDTKELKQALESISAGHRHYPKSVAQLMKHKDALEFTDFDITIITLLSEGYQQKNIPRYLKANNIKPKSLSSVEKRLNYMKETLQFSKNEQLVAYCKDMGIL